ncbi:MAG TPA: ribose 5-phosphate isomerase B [Candidatus Hydrogenedens sp.]|nr:ribose 5-phosphate isomerase B [Candidatus Hydrogenedens sp.]HOL20768.1 ribose 5-phosphate isomerase B [Candidatus Hydrogenedens sp.]HPP57859.1 ribose 5-phosphate isomerase B [Candidatus Hydrogenedens sp.]
MKIGIGCDHAGYEGPPPLYKPTIVEHLKNRGYDIVDYGTFGPEPVDYPDFAKALCVGLIKGEIERGVLICGTGIGVSMSANRFRGIRAAVCTTPLMAELSRTHNDSNVICLGRRILSLEQCIELIDIWLSVPFSNGERHIRRLNKVDKLGDITC